MQSQFFKIDTVFVRVGAMLEVTCHAGKGLYSSYDHHDVMIDRFSHGLFVAHYGISYTQQLVFVFLPLL